MPTQPVKAYTTPYSITIPKSDPDEQVKGNEEQLSNLDSGNLEQTTLSDNSRRKIRHRMEYLLWFTVSGMSTVSARKACIRSRCSVITLTLPAPQKHSDRGIKYECLNRFLSFMRDNCHNLFYIWKAECQSNGNIHFHILSNHHWSMNWVHDIWKHCVNYLGYLDDFAANHGHTDPPATEIHAPRKVNKLMAYFCKYMCKDFGSRAIDGRAWGCDQELSRQGTIRTTLNQQTQDQLRTYIDSGLFRVIKGEEFITIVGDIWPVMGWNISQVMEEPAPG